MPQDDDHAAALEAMAAGEHAETVEDDDEAAGTDDNAENPAVALADAEGDLETAPAQQQRARQKKIQRAQAKATGLQMKKTMIPLLFVSGVILLLLGGLTGIMSAGGGVSETDTFDSGTITLLTIAAFVLGPILIVGGWLLHMDVKKSES